MKEMGLHKLEKSKGTMLEEVYISVLIEHQIKQSAARCEEAIEAKRKAEQELASVQKKAAEDSQLALKKEEAARRVVKRHSSNDVYIYIYIYAFRIVSFSLISRWNCVTIHTWSHCQILAEHTDSI